MKSKFITFLSTIFLLTFISCNNIKSEQLLTLSNAGETDATKIIIENNETTEIPEEIIEEQAEEVEIDYRKEIEEKVKNMTLEDKVSQMFIVAPEAFSNGTTVTSFSDIDIKKLENYNVGGFVMFSKNIINPEQISKLNQDLLNFDNSLFIAVDEEGGQVTRIANNKNFPELTIENLSEAYKGDFSRGYEIGDYIGSYLKKYNFNLDFAPVVDVLINSENTVVKKRSFGSDETIVANMAENVLLGLRNNDILACAKHFPGHGNTTSDTHYGFANSYATLEEMRKTELIPFEKMIENNLEMIMVSHIIYPNLSENSIPATMNKDIVTGLLIEDMGYTGVIITDAMNMGAIANNFTVEESTVKAVLAGNDIILMPTDFPRAYNAVLEAVSNGTISENRIDESVIKILTLKNK